MRPVALAILLALSASSLPSAASAQDDKLACIYASEQGQRLRIQGKLVQARELFAACSRTECPGIVQSDCATWAGQLVDAVPSVVFAARDEHGADLPGVRVLVDGGPAAQRIDGKPFELDPGEHRFRFEGDRLAPAETLAVLHVGQRDRTVSVTMHALPSAERAPLWPPVVLGAVALAAGAAAIVLDVTATSDAQTLRTTCAPSCASSDVDSIRARYVAAGVLGGVGVVSLGAAAYLLLTRGPAREAATPTTAGVFYDLRPSSLGVYGDVGIRF